MATDVEAAGRQGTAFPMAALEPRPREQPDRKRHRLPPLLTRGLWPRLEFGHSGGPGRSGGGAPSRASFFLAGDWTQESDFASFRRMRVAAAAEGGAAARNRGRCGNGERVDR